ncbi:MAG: hypothetical protein Q9Q13_11195 [Acidobacteriota bacterium]|nr:hypothetical protein [Acidobacteriota bacterium]
METWSMQGVIPDPLTDGSGAVIFDLADYEALLRDWTPVAGYSNVDVNRLDLTLGTRYRGAGGWGVELSLLWTDYQDDDPILEDETGRYSRFMALVGKRF